MVAQESKGILALAFVAGLVGGMAGNRLLPTDIVDAQETASRPQVVTVQRLIVVDKAGRTRAELGMSEGGAPRLDLADSEGRSIASVAVTEDGGAELRLNAMDGNPRVRLAVLGNGAPRLDFTMEQDGRSLASLGLSPDGWPDLRLSGKDGSGRGSVMFVDGSPRLFLEDKEGKSNALLASASEKSSLVLYKDGKPRAGLGLNGLDLLNAEGQHRAKLEIMESGEPRLSLKDKDDRRVVSLSVEALPNKEVPLLAMYDEKDLLRVGLNLDESGRPNLILRERPLLSLIDRTGEDGIFLSLERENRPSLLLSSKQGKQSAFLGLRTNNEMALDFLDEAHKPRASLFLDAGGAPWLHLRDHTGKVVSSLAKQGDVP